MYQNFYIVDGHWILSTFGLLQIKLYYICMYNILWGHLFSLWMEWLDHMLKFWSNWRTFLKCLYHVIFQLARYESSSCSTAWPVHGVAKIFFLILDILIGFTMWYFRHSSRYDLQYIINNVEHILCAWLPCIHLL